MAIRGSDPRSAAPAVGSIGNGGRTLGADGGLATTIVVETATVVGTAVVVDGGATTVVVGRVGSGGPSVVLGGGTVVVVPGGGVVVVVDPGGIVVVVGGTVVVDDPGGAVVVVVVGGTVVVVVVVGGAVVVVVLVVVVVVVVESGTSAVNCTLSKCMRPPCPGLDSTRNLTAVSPDIHVDTSMAALTWLESDTSSVYVASVLQLEPPFDEADTRTRAGSLPTLSRR